jgi:hypothetical protein
MTCIAWKDVRIYMSTGHYTEYWQCPKTLTQIQLLAKFCSQGLLNNLCKTDVHKTLFCMCHPDQTPLLRCILSRASSSKKYLTQVPLPNNKRIVSITAPKTNSECILVPTIRQKLWSHSWSRHKLYFYFCREISKTKILKVTWQWVQSWLYWEFLIKCQTITFITSSMYTIMTTHWISCTRLMNLWIGRWCTYTKTNNLK